MIAVNYCDVQGSFGVTKPFVAEYTVYRCYSLLVTGA